MNNGVYDSNLKIGPTQDANFSISQQSFRWRASNLWNKLPIEIKQSSSLNEFKKALRKWIKLNIMIKATNN